MSKKLIIVGSGNAALCAGISALEKGANVKILEKLMSTWLVEIQSILQVP